MLLININNVHFNQQKDNKYVKRDLHLENQIHKRNTVNYTKMMIWLMLLILNVHSKTVKLDHIKDNLNVKNILILQILYIYTLRKLS